MNTLANDLDQVLLHEEQPLAMLDTIVEGTRRTLEFARACGARKVLLTSSGVVYGKQPSDLSHMSEEYFGSRDPVSPRSAYGKGKRKAGLLCALYTNPGGLWIHWPSFGHHLTFGLSVAEGVRMKPEEAI